MSRFFVTAILSIALAACGSDGNESTPPRTGTPITFGPIYSDIQRNVFSPTCAVPSCHQSAGAPQGLRLDEVNSYPLLVNVQSVEIPSIMRVAPFDPDNSYLIQKLEGTAAVGFQMPLDRPALLQSEIDNIRQWISDGALDDRLPSGQPVRVTSLSPLPDEILTASPASIIAMFNRDLDASTVHALTFILEGSGGDGSFGEMNDRPITATAITTASLSATFDLSGVTLANDTYRVRLLGDGASIIMDFGAHALDGEFSGTFPSGDSFGGGDFEATFSLAIP